MDPTHHVAGAEGQRPGQELEERDPERVVVRSVARRLGSFARSAPGKYRAACLRGAVVGSSSTLLRELGRDPEVDEPDLARLGFTIRLPGVTSLWMTSRSRTWLSARTTAMAMSSTRPIGTATCPERSDKQRPPKSSRIRARPLPSFSKRERAHDARPFELLQHANLRTSWPSSRVLGYSRARLLMISGAPSCLRTSERTTVVGDGARVAPISTYYSQLIHSSVLSVSNGCERLRTGSPRQPRPDTVMRM